MVVGSKEEGRAPEATAMPTGAQARAGGCSPGALWVVQAVQQEVGARVVVWWWWCAPLRWPSRPLPASSLSKKGGVSKPPKGTAPGADAVAGRGAAGGSGAAAVVVWGEGCVALRVAEKQGGHVTTKQNDEWLVAHEGKRAGGLLATQNKGGLRAPPSHSRKRQGCRVVVAACVLFQASRCKGTQHIRRARATNPSKWCRSSLSASEAALGATIHTTWRRRDAPGRRVEAGQAGRGVLCVCVCRVGGCRPRNQHWPRAKWGAKNKHAPPPAKRSDGGASVLWPPEGQRAAGGACGAAKPRPRPRETHRHALDKVERQGGNKDDCTNRQEQNVPMWRARGRRRCAAFPRLARCNGSMTRQRRVRPAEGLCVPRNKRPSCRPRFVVDLAWFLCVFGAMI